MLPFPVLVTCKISLPSVFEIHFQQALHITSSQVSIFMSVSLLPFPPQSILALQSNMPKTPIVDKPQPEWVWTSHPSNRSPPGNGNSAIANPADNVPSSSVVHNTHSWNCVYVYYSSFPCHCLRSDMERTKLLTQFIDMKLLYSRMVRRRWR